MKKDAAHSFAFARRLIGLPALEWLNLGSRQISADGRTELPKLRPKLGVNIQKID
jgi:hypothetical protein